MHRALTRKRTPAPIAGVALLGLLALAACGGRTDINEGKEQTTPVAQPGETVAPTEDATGDTSTGTTGVAVPSPPVGSIPTDVPGSAGLVLTGRPGVASTTPKPFDYKGPVNASGSKQDNEAAINASYDTFITNLSGLFENLTPVWRDALAEVATPQMTLAATRTAVAIQRSKSHTIGRLRDATRTITLKGNEALVESCLDEKNWYAVRDSDKRADPGIKRGYFKGRATFVFTSGRWYVNTWNSLPQRCVFTG